MGCLEGKRVLITGASSGIGAATAQLLAEEGAICTLVARDRCRLVETLSKLEGLGHEVFDCNLEIAEAVEDLLSKVITPKAPLFGLVHCAGIELTQPFRATSDADFERVLDINLKAFWYLARHFVKRKNHVQADSRVIVVSSVAGLVGVPAKAAYSASKGAVIALSKSLAIEYACKNIKFNCVCPSYVETPMLDAIKQLYKSEALFQKNLVERHPLGLGSAKDVALAISFLLGPGGRWTTGTVLTVDGGYTAQ